MNEGGEIVGMVDVLKLTYATLEQVSSPSEHSVRYCGWIKKTKTSVSSLDRFNAKQP